MSNTTHHKRLARRLAERTGGSYAACLALVRAAADAGRLPSPLDPDGMDRAVELLADKPTVLSEVAVVHECVSGCPTPLPAAIGSTNRTGLWLLQQAVDWLELRDDPEVGDLVAAIETSRRVLLRGEAHTADSWLRLTTKERLDVRDVLEAAASYWEANGYANDPDDSWAREVGSLAATRTALSECWGVSLDAQAMEGPQRRPEDDAVREAVHIVSSATRHNYGRTIWESGYDSDHQRVVLRMSSWPRAQEAVAGLRAAGWSAGPMEPDQGHPRIWAVPSATEPSAQPVECHAARTGEGYWTCDVVGGCGDCRTLAQEIDDTDQIRAWDEERAERSLNGDTRSADEGDGLYLIPRMLGVLRQVWQGRVTKEATPNGKQARWAIDNKPAPSAPALDLTLLERDGYLEARLVVGDEWVLARTTDFGDQVLAANRADVDKFFDGLPRAR